MPCEQLKFRPVLQSLQSGQELHNSPFAGENSQKSSHEQLEGMVHMSKKRGCLHNIFLFLPRNIYYGYSH